MQAISPAASAHHEVSLVPPHKRVALLICAVFAIGCKDKPTTGALALSINGLPASAQALVKVLGPNGFISQITASTTLENLPPGTYTVAVNPVHYGDAVYASATSQEDHEITAGHTESSTIPYFLNSGSLNISVHGLPAGLAPSLVLTCTSCASFTRVISAPGVVTELLPGMYTLRADTLTSADGDLFGASYFRQSITVGASLAPVETSVDYALVSGMLSVAVNGLGADAQSPAPVTVTGPGNFRRTLAASTSYRGVPPGAYTISAVTAEGACPDIYTPDAASSTTSVEVGSTTQAVVSFSKSQVVASNLNLRIDAAHLIQVVQDYAGGTPMVAGKPALVRVFGIANQCNTTSPKVRLTLGGIPNARTVDLSPTESSVRTRTDQGVLLSSYNLLLPKEDVRPGLTVVAQIDPVNAVPEANETDNRFPANGVKAIDVRVVPPVGIRFVSVVVAGNAGEVSPARMDSLLAFSRELHPALDYDADVRATPYTSSRTGFTAGGGSWSEVLGEIDALRIADSTSTPTGRYYLGVVRVIYHSGVAGIGYIGRRAALSWDFLPTASRIIAHELGHNFGRFHTPCGGPDGVDQGYPRSGDYFGGYIGQYGIDLSDMTLKSPKFYTDIMGYCNLQWISDYTYSAMMQWLIEHPNSAASIASAAVQPTLLVWGRIVNGQPVLEPTFELDARPELPAATGPHRLTALDDAGNEIFSLSFAGHRIADLPGGGDQQTFAFAVPRSMLRGRTLASLRLTVNGRSVTNVASGDVGADPRTSATRVGTRSMRLRWDATRFPAVIVRDATRGEILSFARGGDATIVTDNAPVELIYSNRVGSSRAKVQPR